MSDDTLRAEFEEWAQNQRDYVAWDVYRAAAEPRDKRIAELEVQLPDGMKHCTILFKECARGHGRLTATNWVQHECQTCQIDALESRLAQVAEPLTAASIRLTDLIVGGCSCGTKTPELTYHAKRCQYRVAVEIDYDLRAALADTTSDRVLVPKEPTMGMYDDFVRASGFPVGMNAFYEGYRAALAAAKETP